MIPPRKNNLKLHNFLNFQQDQIGSTQPNTQFNQTINVTKPIQVQGYLTAADACTILHYIPHICKTLFTYHFAILLASPLV